MICMLYSRTIFKPILLKTDHNSLWCYYSGVHKIKITCLASGDSRHMITTTVERKNVFWLVQNEVGYYYYNILLQVKVIIGVGF